nr:uncharacterized protein LOC109416840 [Aedes albopictus]
MPRDDGAEERRKRTVLYKDDVNLTTDRQAPKRVVISKSRYKLYEPPQRSNFSVCLDNIRRERQSIIQPVSSKASTSSKLSYRRVERGSDESHPGTSMQTSFARPQSSMILTERRKLYFKDALIEYKRRRQTAPRRIKIIKVYAPLNWEEAFEESVKKHTPSINVENPWRQPRLQWLQELENQEPLKLPRDQDEPETPCCPLLMFPFRKRKCK